MKFISKINRGVILTVIVVIIVIIYLLINSLYNSSQKPVLEKITNEYLDAYVDYELLPQEHRVKNPSITEDEFAEFVDDMTNELKEFYPEDENYYKYSLQNKIGNLTDQMSGQGVVISYAKSILKFDEFVFTKDSVDVKITTLSSIEYYDPYDPVSQESIKVTQEMEDKIIFQKFDGEWKVVYVNINRPFGEDGPRKYFG